MALKFEVECEYIELIKPLKVAGLRDSGGSARLP